VVYPCSESQSGSPGKERPGGHSRLVSEELPLRNRSSCWGEYGRTPPEFGIPAGCWTGRISRIRILASALGPALDRQAGFTAARPAANLELQWQPVLTVILDDRSLLTCAANGQLSGAARAFRLSHDLLTQFIEAGRTGSR